MTATAQSVRYYHTIDMMLRIPESRLPKCSATLSDRDFMRLFPHFKVGAMYVREHADSGPFYVNTIYENCSSDTEIPSVARRPRRLPLSVNIADFRVIVMAPNVEDPVWWFMEGVPMNCEAPSECSEEIANVMQGYLEAVVDEVSRFLAQEMAGPATADATAATAA